VNRDPRLYQLSATIVAILLFLLIASGTTSLFFQEESPRTPKEEVLIAYAALLMMDDWPQELTQSDLRSAMESLEPDLGEIASNINIISYERSDYFFIARVSHTGQPDRVYTIGIDGVY